MRFARKESTTNMAKKRKTRSKLAATNPARIKGHKVNGGRAVSLKNFTGKVVKHANGAISILGIGKKK